MKGYLLDTNVTSEARKGSERMRMCADGSKRSRMRVFYLSVLALGEIRKGIEQARARDPAKASALERWLGELEKTYSDRLLPVTGAIADQWGRLSAIRPVSSVDGLLAATALIHDLTFVTRNVTDVAGTGVTVMNPFEAS